MSYVLHHHIFIGSGSYQGGVPYLGRDTTILIAVAQRTPFWTVDSVDPSLSDATQPTMLEYSAGRMVGDSYSTTLDLSFDTYIKNKSKGRGKEF